MPFGEQPATQQGRRPVKDRWFYELVEGSKTGLLSIAEQENLGGEDKMVVGGGDKEEQKFLLLKNSEMDKMVINFGTTDQIKMRFSRKQLEGGRF